MVDKIMIKLKEKTDSYLEENSLIGIIVILGVIVLSMLNVKDDSIKSLINKEKK